MTTDELHAALARTSHRRGPFGEPLYFFDEVGSTNDEAARLAERGATHGTTVVASSQTSGRGRLGRSWFSPPDSGLYVSVILRQPELVPLLTLAAGVAIADAIRTITALPVEIKWPNDIVVESGLGKRRKLAGILTEGATGADGLQHVVLGFGINLLSTAYPPEIAARATSLAAELGRSADRLVLLAECLATLAERVDQLSTGKVDGVLARWRALSPSSVGARVDCETADGPLRGVTAGIDNDGALLVRAGDRIQQVRSGQVTWL